MKRNGILKKRGEGHFSREWCTFVTTAEVRGTLPENARGRGAQTAMCSAAVKVEQGGVEELLATLEEEIAGNGNYAL